MTRLTGTSRLAAAIVVLLCVAACGSIDKDRSGDDRTVHVEPMGGGGGGGY